MSNADLDQNFERSVTLVRDILESLEALRQISPCIESNCPRYADIEKLGDCPTDCRYLLLRHEKNRLYLWLCGGKTSGRSRQNGR